MLLVRVHHSYPSPSNCETLNFFLFSVLGLSFILPSITNLTAKNDQVKTHELLINRVESQISIYKAKSSLPWSQCIPAASNYHPSCKRIVPIFTQCSKKCNMQLQFSQ